MVGKVKHIEFLSYAQKTGFAIITIEDVTNINTALGDAVVASGLQESVQSS